MNSVLHLVICRDGPARSCWNFGIFSGAWNEFYLSMWFTIRNYKVTQFHYALAVIILSIRDQRIYNPGTPQVGITPIARKRCKPTNSSHCILDLLVCIAYSLIWLVGHNITHWWIYNAIICYQLITLNDYQRFVSPSQLVLQFWIKFCHPLPLPLPLSQSPGALFNNMNWLYPEYGEVITCPVRCGVKWFINSQTSSVQPSKFGNGWIISSHTV